MSETSVSAWPRLRDELRDLLECVLIPGLAAILPWSVAYRLFRRVAATRWLYQASAERALGEASRLGWAGQPEGWLLRRRLTTLIDHADHYLTRTRGDGWLARHVDLKGDWPPAGTPALCLTFHWGAGMWGLRSAASSGVAGHMLVASPDARHFRGRAILHRYILARIRSIEQALGRPCIDVTTDVRQVPRALKAGDAIFAVIDVPPDQVSASVPVSVLGMPARLPTPLLRMAVERRIPVWVYLTGYSVETGQRFVRSQTLGVPESLDELVRQVTQELEQAIRDDAPMWHFWGEAQRFFRH